MTLILLMMSELTPHSRRVTLPRKIRKDLCCFFFLFDFSIYFSLFLSLFFVAFLLCIYSIFLFGPACLISSVRHLKKQGQLFFKSGIFQILFSFGSFLCPHSTCSKTETMSKKCHGTGIYKGINIKG